jgi:hypothetical protein
MRLPPGKVLGRDCLAMRIGKRLRSLWIYAGFFASESSNATNPIVFEPMVMSIVLGHQKKLGKLEHKLAIADEPMDEPNKEPQL